MNEIDTVAKAAYSRGAQTFSYYEEPWWRTYRFKSGIFSDAPHFPIPFLFSIFIDFPSTFRSSNFSNFYLCFFFYCGPFLYCPWAFYCIGSWLGVSGQFLLTNNRNNNFNYVYSLYVDIRLCVARVVSFEFHFLSLFYCL